MPDDFRVVEFPPTLQTNKWIYATIGMSPIEDEIPLEVHIFSAERDESIIELLTTIVYYHRNTRRLGLGHTVNFGRPWREQSGCYYGLISLPYLDGPKLENLIVDNKKQIKFYWLIPIMEAEKEFRIKYGLEALEQKFDRGFDYCDVSRKSLV